MADAAGDRMLAEVAAAFGACGHLDYGEHISMGEHMLQSAACASEAGADEAILQALSGDIS